MSETDSSAEARGGWRGRGRGPARLQVRSRIALIVAIAVGLALLLSSEAAYLTVRQDLVSGVDTALSTRARLLNRERVNDGLARALESIFAEKSALSRGPIVEVVEASGVVVAPKITTPALRVDVAARQVAAAGRGSDFASTTEGGTPIRVLVTSFGRGLALQLVEPVGQLEAELDGLARVLAIAAGVGVVVALLLGAGIAGLALAPVRRLTKAAERVAATQDLAQRIPVEGRDELSRLAASINSLLSGLAQSQAAQRQLVADASHELRTPLTSLRTNVEILAGATDLPDEMRHQLVGDLTSQFDALSRLVSDVIELARQEESIGRSRSTETVALDAVVSDVVSSLQASYRRVRIVADVSPAFVEGVAADLERAVGNLVDNAAKWSDDSGVVEVSLTRSGSDVLLVVADHGPGIAPEDLSHVFDRFFRARDAGPVPGSGLGLAIVQRIVEAHGGSIRLESERGTGARFIVSLQGVDPPP